MIGCQSCATLRLQLEQAIDATIDGLEQAQRLAAERDRLAGLLGRFVNGLESEWDPMWRDSRSLRSAMALLEEAEAALSGRDST